MSMHLTSILTPWRLDKARSHQETEPLRGFPEKRYNARRNVEFPCSVCCGCQLPCVSPGVGVGAPLPPRQFKALCAVAKHLLQTWRNLHF